MFSNGTIKWSQRFWDHRILSRVFHSVLKQCQYIVHNIKRIQYPHFLLTSFLKKNVYCTSRIRSFLGVRHKTCSCKYAGTMPGCLQVQEKSECAACMPKTFLLRYKF
ncbi:hypothetical protein AAHE18_14G198300 [Arachis hypogaea]